MKTLIQVVLVVLIFVMGYFLVESIAKPIRFKKVQEMRYDKVINNLKDIRTAQLAFKEVNGRFTGSFDTLVSFVKYDSLPIIFKKGEIPEEMLGKITEMEAIKKGLITRDTIRISVIDSIFADNYPIDSLRFAPFTSGREFIMSAGVVVTGSKLKVKVFEARIASKYVLQGLDEQLIINMNDRKPYKGLKVGSLEEANNSAGNWE